MTTHDRSKVRDAVGAALTALDNGTAQEVTEMDDLIKHLNDSERRSFTHQLNEALGIHPMKMDTEREAS